MAAPPILDRITVTEAVHRYLRGIERGVLAGTLSATTQSTYQRDMREFTRLSGAETIVDDITAEDLDDLLLTYASEPDRRYAPAHHKPSRSDHIYGGRSPATQARFRHSLSRFFAHAQRAGWIQHNPVPDMQVKPRARGEIPPARKALPEATALTLLETLTPRTDSALSYRDDAIIRILMEVGLRVAELCAVNQSDIETHEDITWLVIRVGKGGKHRDVPLSPSTAAAVDRYVHQVRPTPPQTDPAQKQADAQRALFVTFRGRRMQPRDVQNMLNRCMQKLPAEVRRACTPHGLRHTAATLLLSSGAADIKTVQRILGHASLATTGMYLDEVREDMIRAVGDHPVTGE